MPSCARAAPPLLHKISQPRIQYTHLILLAPTPCLQRCRQRRAFKAQRSQNTLEPPSGNRPEGRAQRVAFKRSVQSHGRSLEPPLQALCQGREHRPTVAPTFSEKSHCHITSNVGQVLAEGCGSKSSGHAPLPPKQAYIFQMCSKHNLGTCSRLASNWAPRVPRY
jgi:hypothetical protein